MYEPDTKSKVDKAKLSVSVIMPCLNEELNIKEAVLATLKAFDEKNIAGEIIVVDDGSTDSSPLIIKNLKRADHRVSSIRHSQSEGIGSAFIHGVKQAGSDIVVMFPGDNENNPMDAFTYVELLTVVDIVIPFVQNVEVRSKYRRLLSSIYRLVINLSFGTSLNYTNGTVFYNRHMLQNIELKSKGFFYQTELLIRLIRQGYLYAETPNFLYNRNFGKSKAISLGSLLSVCISYLSLIFDIHIRRSIGQIDVPIIKNSATYRRQKVQANSNEL
jgi:phenylacetate-CoA ligase